MSIVLVVAVAEIPCVFVVAPDEDVVASSQNPQVANESPPTPAKDDSSNPGTMTESGEFVHEDVVAVPTHEESDGEIYSESCDAGEKSLRSWSKSKMLEMKSSVIVAVWFAVAVFSVVVAIAEAVVDVEGEEEHGEVVTPAETLPAKRDPRELLKLWMAPCSGEEDAEEGVVVKVSLSMAKKSS